MKVRMALFVFFAAVNSLSASVDTAQNTSLAQNCTTNPFIYHLKLRNVEVFQSPLRDLTSHCGQEWQHFGLCCNETQLVEFAKADQANINRSVTAVLTYLNEILVSYESAMNKSLQIQKSEFKIICRMAVPLVKLLQAKSSITFRGKLRSLLRKQNFELNLNNCWSKISSARSNSLCSVCSGRSSTFFSDDRILMLEADCSNILTECAPSFDNLVQIVELLADHSVNLEKLDGSTWLVITKQFEYLKNLTEVIKSQEIHKSIERYLDKNEKEKNDISGSLCSKFLNINGPTFVQKLERLLKNLKLYKLDYLMEIAVEKVSEHKKERLRKKKSHRLLTLLEFPNLPHNETADQILLDTEELPPIELLFQGDVKVIHNDHQDTSTDPKFLQNRTASLGQTEGQAFDITNPFP